MDIDIQSGGSPEEVAAQQEEQAKIDQARAELVDEAGQNNLILGKYKDVDALTEGYKNLQREVEKLRGSKPADPEPVAEQQAEPEVQPEVPQVTAENQAVIDDIVESVVKQVGGADRYELLGTWAKVNLDADRLNAYNEAINSADKGRILTAVKGLQYDYMMSTGYEPRLTGGRAAPQASEVKGFSSKYEMTAAMSDPRYQKDNAYRKEIERRMAVTPNSFFGMKE